MNDLSVGRSGQLGYTVVFSSASQPQPIHELGSQEGDTIKHTACVGELASKVVESTAHSLPTDSVAEFALVSHAFGADGTCSAQQRASALKQLLSLTTQGHDAGVLLPLLREPKTKEALVCLEALYQSSAPAQDYQSVVGRQCGPRAKAKC